MAIKMKSGLYQPRINFIHKKNYPWRRTVQIFTALTLFVGGVGLISSNRFVHQYFRQCIQQSKISYQTRSSLGLELAQIKDPVENRLIRLDQPSLAYLDLVGKDVKRQLTESKTIQIREILRIKNAIQITL